ncbi:MAG: hypothetical protein IKZ54_06000 [Bacteroidales bacterium]|nr:hypothetical protein [Bacteroidales bacterium]
MPTNPKSDTNDLNGRTKLLRFGLLLNEDQQEIVIERIQELCVENFTPSKNTSFMNYM